MKLLIFILLITSTHSIIAESFTIDTNNREEVRNFFNTIYQASENIPISWTGNIEQCIPGTISQEYRDAIELRINFFRAMAGIPADIKLTAELNHKAQQAALMMAANNQINHYPDKTWSCYTDDGVEAARSSNLSLGSIGSQAVFGQMEDAGDNNKPVGHRRWLLYPFTTKMGTGDVKGAKDWTSIANSIWVFDDDKRISRPITRDEFVSWPPSGFVPYQLTFPRWSFSYPDADFNNAKVTMQQQGQTVSLKIIHKDNSSSIGDNTLVWEPNISAQTTDIIYFIAINNVMVNGIAKQFNYTTTIIDPSIFGVDSILPAISGTSQPVVNQDNIYDFNPVHNATGYQLLQAKRKVFTQQEGAETGINNLTTDVSSGYQIITTDIQANGSASFHLAHPKPSKEQILTFNHTFLLTDSSKLNFSSRLGLASSDQIAKVQVSTDDGQIWQDIFTQAGTGDSGENGFSNQTISLAKFDNKSIQLRFNYFLETGTYYPQTDSGIGWYIDDITFTNVEELTNRAITDIPLTDSFIFNPAEIGDYALQMRAKVYEKYPLEWGNTKLVTAQLDSSDAVSIPSVPNLTLTKIGKIVTATWDIIAETTGYNLYYAPYPDVNYIKHIDMEQQISFSVELTIGTAFYVGITAYNKVGESGYSNIEYFIID